MNPGLAEKVKKELNNYTLDRNGLKNVASRYGGEAFIKQAVNYGNKNRKVKDTLGRFGMTPDQLGERAISELRKDGTYDDSSNAGKRTSSFRDRLDNLR